MKYLVCIILSISSIQLYAQQCINFSIKADKDYLDVPVSFSLDHIGYNADSLHLALYEISNRGEKSVPSQLEIGYTTRLWFLLEGYSAKNSVRKFVLKMNQGALSQKVEDHVHTNKSDGAMTFYFKEQPVLSYRFETMFPPIGIDPLYKRSGFIHPLWSPKGEVLSRVQPPDHYHHYGIWGPWTLTHIGDRKVDFWNLNKGEGTVKFAGFLSEITGNVFSAIRVLQQHIDFGAKGEDQIAMNEVLDIRVWNSNSGVWIIDYTTSVNTPLKNGIKLDAYRYGGGIGFRSTEKWTKGNCTVLTSEGKTRTNADGSHARWCIVEGESEIPEGRSGILFLSHPSNRAHPEPMRVWPIDANEGRGDLFFEFSPIRHQSWELARGCDYVLRYRMIVFDGHIDKEKAEVYWNSFSGMPEIEFAHKAKNK
ncbi:MAG: PmoA family protein [Proteiniphilum sp.]|nr:PmoA family protein [Proteiniphilum sp.]